MALIQSPNTIIMIRPWKFHSNPETSRDNAFQNISSNDNENISQNALLEFNKMVEILEKNGIKVHVFDDFGEKETPDSVFPNNWFSTHPGGHVAIYSMYSPSRRRERRADIIEMLKREYRVQDVVDYSGLEWDNLFLEGTGAMVFDHLEKVAYTAKSNRASDIILERFCAMFRFEPMAFKTADRNGKPIYHTNVMMTIGSNYALICLKMIVCKKRREEIKQRLLESGREVIELSFDQIDNFAGNAIELTNDKNQTLLAISKRAYESLKKEQLNTIEKYAKIVPIPIPTVELAGGSVRCMIAGVHLKKR